MKNISIIVLLYNGEEFVENCLSSLKSAVSDQEEILLVDNHSSDRTVDIVKERYPEFQIVELDRNLGFSGGMNYGIDHTSGEILLFLNQDIQVDKDLIKNIIKGFSSEETGVIGCKIYFPGTKMLQHAGGIIHSNGLTNHIGYRENDTGQYNKITEVDYVTGAAFAIRRDIMIKLGKFDDDFFPGYYEETDICFRTRILGKKVIYRPDCMIYHYEATTMKFESFRYLRTYHRNRLRFLFKNYTLKHILTKGLKKELMWLFKDAPASNYIPLWIAYMVLPFYWIKLLFKKRSA